MTTDIFTAEDIQDLFYILNESIVEAEYECNIYKGSSKEREAKGYLQVLLNLKKKIDDRYTWDIYGVTTDLRTGKIVGE